MKNFIKSKYFTYILAAAFSIAFVAFFIFNPSHAFFQVHKDFTGVNTAKVDLLFDKFDASGTYGEISVDLGATWGTPTNPYVIDDTNHISNLSVLQKSGYFNSKDHQCFFVVCTPTGYPVAIDCDGMEIAPIGSPARPFTGSIQGAPLAVSDYTGEGTPYTDTKFTNVYTVGNNNFTVTQSTIANLVVAATDSTPDIGFFGRLSYTGEVKDVVTEEKDEDGNVIASVTTKQLTGFAANLDNLLFADVTITTKQNPGSDLAAWWAQFTGTREDGTLYSDQAHEGCDETHHLGIIAGHAEWAKITKISVYYSEDVPAFNVGEDTTNYYSIVGLIGTLSYVNPTDGTTAGTATAVGSVSDKQLSEELLSGGGGEGSGMLTGYMLAENIFNRKDSTVQATALDYYAEAYDVRDLTEGGKPIFTVQNMIEKHNSWSTEIYRNYYYFADTVFTFAMTTSVETDEDGVETGEHSLSNADYLIKIWKTTENNIPIVQKAVLTDLQSDWTYTEDSSIEQSLYSLTPATGIASGEANKYVLAYNAGTAASPKLYVLDMFNQSSGYAVPIATYIDTTQGYTVSSQGDQINQMYILNLSGTAPSYSFLYNLKTERHGDTNNDSLSVAITDVNKKLSFGVTALRQENYQNVNLNTMGYLEKSNEKMYDLNAWASDSDLRSFGWQFNFDGSNDGISNNVTVTDKFTFYNTGSGWSAYSTKLVFNITTNRYEVIRGTIGTNSSYFGESNAIRNRTDPTVDKSKYDDNLLLFKVTKVNTSTPPKTNNFTTTEDKIEWEFDPSTDVLFCDPAVRGTTQLTLEQIEDTKSYTVTPLLSKKWNNGRGEYLSQLNHAVKLGYPRVDNFQMNFSNTPLPDWFKDILKSNTGGVVLAPLGTTGVHFSMPAGTIAFYVNKAAADDPSFINIIVAVGPEDGNATIGLFGPQDITQTKTSLLKKIQRLQQQLQ